jgi:RimJ/RimL family protein N-acetyltransferase
MKVRIRPLQELDAAVSYKWRNNPDVWRYTENKPNANVTYEIELNWLRDALKRHNEKRFAICVGEDDYYIGNVQLTDINEKTAQFHIFIGELSCHGMGFGTRATQLLLEYAFSILGLVSVYLFVNKKNIGAIKLYEKCGFVQVEEIGEIKKMEILDERNRQ